MLPVPVMAELARLQDNITPFNTDAARAVIEADLGQPIDAIFSEFSVQPIAAASLAQAGVPSQSVTEHTQGPLNSVRQHLMIGSPLLACAHS